MKDKQRADQTKVITINDRKRAGDNETDNKKTTSDAADAAKEASRADDTIV